MNSFLFSGSQKARDRVNTVGFPVGLIMDKVVHGQAQLGFPLRVTIPVALHSHCS